MLAVEASKVGTDASAGGSPVEIGSETDGIKISLSISFGVFWLISIILNRLFVPV